ncbi:MAG: DUF4412 domain-containing protein [Bacteroidetes bacterium]|nr:DUF4412 domain-containing protein [Bacteroidota bacterium]
MKKIVLNLVALALIIGGNVFAQFNGTITYKMDFGMKDMPAEAKEMLKNSEMKISTKGDMSRVENNTAMAKSIIITNNKTQKVSMLMDMMGSKYNVIIPPEEIKKDKEKPDVKVKELNETKEIIGYNCKKAEVTFTDAQSGKSFSSIVYYTDKIPYNVGYQAQFKGLKGFPLEYTISDAATGMNITLAATKISKDAVDDNLFKIPEGYKEIALEDLSKQMMQDMGGGR